MDEANTERVKVSVIMPVYNVEPYIRQCLDSVINQTLKEIQIICVDDGSDDGSLEILKEYESKDSRVKALEQEHRFAGTARNYGMSVAEGKYLVFWDSDDYFYETALEDMYNQCEEDKADICICGGRRYFEELEQESPNPRYLRPKDVPDVVPFNRKTAPDSVLPITVEAPWNKMFRKEFVESTGVKFKEIRNANDVYFVVMNLCLAETITLVRKPLVCYRRKDSGLVSTVSKGLLNALKTWVDAAEDLKARDAFPERSFANRALESIIYLLGNTGDWEVFKEGLLYLQDGNLDKMCITHREDEEFYLINFHNEAARRLHEDSPEVFSRWLGNLYLQREAVTVARLRHESEEHRFTTKDLNRTIKEKERAERKIGYLENDIKNIKNSVSFKFGRIVTWVPRHLKAFIKGEKAK